MNKFTATPNVITTLNLYRFKNIQSYKKMYNNKNKAININHLKDLQLIKDEMINGSLIADSCKHVQLYALEQMYVANSVTMYSKLSSLIFVRNEIAGVLFQVYAFLRIYQNVFTHYDLHLKNILLVQIPNRTLSFTYIDTILKQQVSFTSNYLIKIIDYSRSYCQKTTESFRALLCQQTKDCKNCGKFDGYYQLSNDEKPDDLNYLKSSYVNRSTDLRLLDTIMPIITKFNPVLSNILKTVQYLKDADFSPEIRKSGIKKNKINNVEDAYQMLFQSLKEMKHTSQSNTPVYGKFTIDTTPLKSMDDIKSQTAYTFTLV